MIIELPVMYTLQVLGCSEGRQTLTWAEWPEQTASCF